MDGPYSDIPTNEKTKLQAMVPINVAEELRILLPRHGIITCVMSILFHSFYVEFRRRLQLNPALSPRERIALATEILTNISYE